MDLDFSSGAVVRQRVVVPSRARGPRYRQEDPDNDEELIAMKALVSVQNRDERGSIFLLRGGAG